MKTEHTEEQIGCATNNSNCCKRAEVPSDEELAALSDMREIKTRVKELKKRLSEISRHNDEHLIEKSRLEKEMKEAKELRQELRRTRGAAYTASQNYSNASSYRTSSAADYIGAAGRGRQKNRRH